MEHVPTVKSWIRSLLSYCAIHKKTTKQRKNKTKSKQTLTSCSRELDERDHSKLEDLWHLLLAKNKTKTILSFSRISTVSSVYKQLVLDYMFCWHNRIKLHCVSKKQDTKLLPITSPNVNRFSKFFHWQFPGKFATNTYLNIPPHLKYVATLPCEIWMSENWQQSEICVVIDDESQHSTAKHLSYDGLLHSKFVNHCAGKRIFLIREHLAKLRAKSFSRLGLGPQNEHLSVIIRTGKNLVICDYHFTRV